jgi:hypothetical protein
MVLNHANIINNDVLNLIKALPKDYHVIKTTKPLVEQFKSNPVEIEVGGYVDLCCMAEQCQGI